MPLWLALSTPAFASHKDGERQTPYQQGKTRVGLSGGGFGGRGGVDLYVAGSFGVFVIDNLELGVDASVQFGDADPIGQLGPQLRYILPFHEVVHPYLGVFYRHWFGPDSLLWADSAGARAGLLIRSRGVFLLAGVVYEAALGDCVGDGCDDWYPEFGVSFVL